jgi:hypothetical protein
MIEEEYRSHFLVDNLPVAMSVFHESEEGMALDQTPLLGSSSRLPLLRLRIISPMMHHWARCDDYNGSMHV